MCGQINTNTHTHTHIKRQTYRDNDTLGRFSDMKETRRGSLFYFTWCWIFGLFLNMIEHRASSRPLCTGSLHLAHFFTHILFWHLLTVSDRMLCCVCRPNPQNLTNPEPFHYPNESLGLNILRFKTYKKQKNTSVNHFGNRVFNW